MGRFATKNTLERENEEAERLVRPAPKVKPPRHDKRREDIEIDRDPDTERDPDLKGDPDLSLNFKTIGGSLAQRVVAGFKEAKEELINVRRKEDNKVTQVTKKTLKEKPSEYELIDENKGEKLKKPNERADAKAAEAFAEMAASDPKLDSKLKSLVRDFKDPKSSSSRFLESRPDSPAEHFVSFDLPEGVKTLADLQRILLRKKKPKRKSETKSKPKDVDTESQDEEAQDIETQDVQDDEPEEDEAQDDEEVKPPKAKKKEKKERPQTKAETRPGRPVSVEEQDAARRQLVYTFPPDVSSTLLLSKLHPDEITSLISTYHAAQAAKGHDLKKVKETAPKFYQTDANKVSPPTKILKDGVEVEFKDLPPEEQAKELVKHQIKTVAMSLAARDLLTKDLVAKGTPEELATRLADIQLSPQRDEHGEAANKTAEKLFHEALAIGPSPVSTSVVEKTLKSITNPAALKAAVAYFQACDYQEAREKYLEPGSEEHISEHQEPSAIANQLINAVKALRKRSGSYPDGSTTVDMAGLFQNRVMKHLGTLAPEKVPLIQNVLDVEDNEQYDEAVKKHHKAIKKYEAQQAKLQEAYDKKFNVVNDHYLELFSPVKIDAKKLRTEGEEEFDLGGDTSAWDTEHTIETPSGSRIIGVLHRGDNPGYDDHHFKTKVLPGIVDAAKKALSAGKKVKFLAEGMKGGGEYSEQRAIAHALGALGADVSQDTWDDESVAPWEGYPDDSNPVITPTLPIVRSLTQFSGGDSDLAIAGLYATLVGQGDEIKLTPSIKKTLKSLSIDPEDKDALYAATFPSDTGGKPNPLSRIADEYNRIRQENLLTKIKQEEGNGVVAIATPGASHAYALKPFVERTFKKQGKPPKIPQGISAVMEEKGIFAPQEPIKPPRYDLKRKKPEELTEDASQMWGDFALRFASSKRQAARVVLKHFFYPYSIYPDTSAMGQQRQAVYWGVDPNKDAISYPGWEQAQARDLGERDYNRILTAAREWLRTPVLSKNIEGVVRDTQLRAALDLAVRTEWYESALHPTVYNNLLAKLAGVSQNETLVTVRSASAGKGTVRNNMTMPKFAGKNADQLLARLDRMASTIQDNHETWGMPFPVAKGLVNDIDKMADEIEEASFGVDSLLTRQTEIIAKTAEVIQRDTDEPYMDSFKNPHEPVQTEADEPYMSAYSNDDSSDVRHGKTDTGRPLAP